MNRNWDIMGNAANGADPYGTTRPMAQNRRRDRESYTAREEGMGSARNFDGIPDYGQSRYGSYRSERQGYGGESRQRGSSQLGGYGYEHGESEAHGYDRDRDRERGQERGFLGRIEEGIDRAFGNDWDRDERYRGMRGMRGDRDMNMRDEEHPSLWDRVKGAFTGGTFSGKGPKNWTRSDERIREDVCECLTYHPNVDASEIDVVVKDAEVTLTGTVSDRGSKRLAEDIVEDVRGVKDVHNQLRVVRQMPEGIGEQTARGTSTTGAQQAGTSGMPTNQAWNQARR